MISRITAGHCTLALSSLKLHQNDLGSPGGVHLLLAGVNHVAILTNNTDRLHAFYREVFDAKVSADRAEAEGIRLSMVDERASER